MVALVLTSRFILTLRCTASVRAVGDQVGFVSQRPNLGSDRLGCLVLLDRSLPDRSLAASDRCVGNPEHQVGGRSTRARAAYPFPLNRVVAVADAGGVE